MLQGPASATVVLSDATGALAQARAEVDLPLLQVAPGCGCLPAPAALSLWALLAVAFLGRRRRPG